MLLNSIGNDSLFLSYAFIGVPAFLFVRTFVIETKGRSPEQIATDLREKSVAK